MGKKETSVGGKKFIHKKGFIDKGLLFKGQVYPLFSDKQNAKSWNILNSINSKNIKKKDLDRLKASLKEASTDREREEAYIAFNKERGIQADVSIMALELSNNRNTENFIKGSTDEFQDFNKVVRGKTFIRVNKGKQETVPKVEEVSGQGLKKSKTKPKIEEPKDDDDDELKELVKKFLEETKKIGDEGGVRGRTLESLYKKYFNGYDNKEVAKELLLLRKSKPKDDETFMYVEMDEKGNVIPPPPPPDAKGIVANKEQMDKIVSATGGNVKMKIRELEEQTPPPPPTPPPPTTPPPPPPSPIEQPPKQTETAEEISEQIDSRLMEQEGTAGYSGEQGEEGLDLDDEEDIGIHNESIQRVSTMNDYDFTFTKKSLLQVNPLPNDPKMLKEMGERCIREYGHLLGILEPKDNYSKKEVEELYTLKHILKQVIRLEAQYKRALLKMRISVSSGGNNQLDKLMNNGQLGLVLNAGSLNISPQQAVEQSSTSPLKTQEQQQTQQPQQTQEQKPVDVFQELNEKKIKGKRKGKEKERRRMNLMYQRKRKAMLREPKNIVLRGRINDPPQYQNLRTEAERINENPTPLVFKSNSRLNQMRRFNVNY